MTADEQGLAARALIERLAPTLAGVEHSVGLAALLSLFRSIALQSPCCTQSAGEQCMGIGLELILRSAGQQPPSGAPIH